MSAKTFNTIGYKIIQYLKFPSVKHESAYADKETAYKKLFELTAVILFKTF